MKICFNYHSVHIIENYITKWKKTFSNKQKKKKKKKKMKLQKTSCKRKHFQKDPPTLSLHSLAFCWLPTHPNWKHDLWKAPKVFDQIMVRKRPSCKSWILGRCATKFWCKRKTLLYVLYFGSGCDQILEKTRSKVLRS